MPYALISVSDKTNIEYLATTFNQLNITILATGGTAAYLKQRHISYVDIVDYTGFAEIMGGRVKTLHPKIHGGILARRGIDDDCLQQNKIHPIDYVVVNLYPFEATINQANCQLNDAIEKIDIGGPTLLRAAAKNYHHVTAIIDPNDYPDIIETLTQHKPIDQEKRLALARKVFAHTAHYDTCINQYFNAQLTATTTLPTILTTQYPQKETLRYGENPHQQATLYLDPNSSIPNLTDAKQIQGKALSYNNLVDANAAYQCANGFFTKLPCCAIIKHATPCGIAQAPTLLEAYQRAYAADSASAFGGIIAFNQSVDAHSAKIIIEQQFVEVIIAPQFEDDAVVLFKQKPNIRLLECQHTQQDTIELHSISGGLLAQQTDNQAFDINQFSVVTHKKPNKKQMDDLLFCWHAVRQVKSNAIVLARNGQTLGIGSGQTSRVLSTELAILKAKHAKLDLSGSVMASDAFFPFADGLERAIEAGVSAVIQPGGSKRDPEVINAADDAGIAMVMTHQRCFKH